MQMHILNPQSLFLKPCLLVTVRSEAGNVGEGDGQDYWAGLLGRPIVRGSTRAEDRVFSADLEPRLQGDVGLLSFVIHLPFKGTKYYLRFAFSNYIVFHCINGQWLPRD